MPNTSIRTQAKTVKRNNPQNSQWSFVLPSFVVHGIRPTEEASEAMPRKMDRNGDMVMTPGFGFKYEGPQGGLLVGGVVKDCYDNFAGTLQYGYYSHLTKHSSWGATIGFYVRETPLVCQTQDFGSHQSTQCHSMDRFDFKFQTQMNGQLVDIIPMPFFHFSTSLYKDSDVNIYFKVMTNVVLNEFALAVPF